MNRLYFLNNNRNEPFTYKELESKLIFEDDLVWYEGLDDWSQAKTISELNSILKKRPPVSNKTKKLISLKKVATKSFVIFFIFSLILGISSALFEKNQFKNFYKQIEASHKENEQIKLKQKIKTEYLENKRNEKLESKISKLYQDIDKIKELEKLNFDAWQIELNSINPDFLKIEEYEKKNEQLIGSKNYLIHRLDELQNSKGFFNEETETTLDPIVYDIPNNELYAYSEDGEIWTRWCSYGSNFTENENLSYETCSSFLFRPYIAIFSDANLSQREQESNVLLIFNFILSSVISNLPLLFILLVVFYKKSFKKNAIK